MLLAGLPASIFKMDSENGDMFRTTVCPYRNGQSHIQELPVDECRMAVRFNLKQSPRGPRIVISLAEHDIRGDKFQGTLCDLGESGTSDTLTTDALVVVGPSLEVENRFIVTTVDGVDDATDKRLMKAAICSNIPPAEGVTCDGADDSGLCNFHGFVNVRFTMTADVLP